MPSYTFRNKSTGEEWTEFLSMSACEEKLLDENIQQLPSSFSISTNGGPTKPDSGFRDVLKTIKSNNIRSKINTF